MNIFHKPRWPERHGMQRWANSVPQRACAARAALLVCAGLGAPTQVVHGAPPAAAAPAAAQSEAAPLRLRIVGGLAGVNQYQRHEAPFWTQTVPRLSQGRITAEIVPHDSAGIRSQEMLRLIQLGAVPFGTALLSRVSLTDPELAAGDLAGLNPDMATLRRNFAAFRPVLERTMRERYGIEVLAVYVYPAQMIFCRQAFTQLSDLAGRRVRVANASQADLMRALGAQPVSTEFSEMVANLRGGAVDCAVTGAMSGNSIGLHEVTTHLYSQGLSWGVSVFAANAAAWAALPETARALLRQELPRLEAAIWAESEAETSEGVACNTQRAGCRSGKPGRMVEVRATADDAQRLRAIFASAVLPAWVQRCGASCAQVWNEHLAPQVGVRANLR